MSGVVVSVEYNIEARHTARYLKCGIVKAAVGLAAVVYSGMEQAHDNVGTLVLLHNIHPLLSRLYSILKVHAAPQCLREPRRNTRCYETNNGYLDISTLKDDVGLVVRLGCSRIGDVGTEHRARHLLNPLVVYGMPRLYIVVAHGAHVVAHIVAHRRGYVLGIGAHIIVVCNDGLTLQHVAGIHQQEVVAVYGA